MEIISSISTITPSFFSILRTITSDSKNFPSILFKTNPSLSCSSSLFKIVNESENKITISLNFLGYIGTDSPLPSYFKYEAQHHRAEYLCDFFDILNTRTYALFFSAFEVATPFLSASNADFAFWNIVESLAGFPHNTHPLPLLPYFIPHSRSAFSLQQLLQSFLAPIPLRLYDNVARFYSMSPSFLGSTILGDTSFLGNFLLNTRHFLSLKIGPISFIEKEFIENDLQTIISLIIAYNPIIEVVELSLIFLKKGSKSFKLLKKGALMNTETRLGRKTADTQLNVLTIAVRNHTQGQRQKSQELFVKQH
jgi:hypothetical protein